MQLCVFITKISDENAAELFNVSVRTAAAWRRLERVPRPQKTLEILYKTAGKVDWQGIYEPFVKHHAKKKSSLICEPHTFSRA